MITSSFQALDAMLINVIFNLVKTYIIPMNPLKIPLPVDDARSDYFFTGIVSLLLIKALSSL